MKVVVLAGDFKLKKKRGVLASGVESKSHLCRLGE
jgi:hypothetical protein